MIKNFSRSLESLLGAEYTSAVCRARAALTGESEQALVKLAQEPVEFYPDPFAARQEILMEQVGRQLCPPAQAVSAEPGAPTDSFAAAQHYAPRRSARSAASASARTDGCILPERASTITFRSATASRATRCWTGRTRLAFPMPRIIIRADISRACSNAA